MPPYKLKQVNDAADFDPVIELILGLDDIHVATVSRSLFRSPGTVEETDSQASFEFAKHLLWTGHQAQPDSTWWLAVDEETGQGVGCCQWRIFTSEQPFGPDGFPVVTASWCPEGEEREFCTSLFNQNLASRKAWMNLPHAGKSPSPDPRKCYEVLTFQCEELGWMAVAPKHRCRGIARQLMEAGIERADRLGLGAWLEATDMGAQVYKRFNFRTILKTFVPMDKENPSLKWKKMQAELLPQDFDSMWRPPRGHWSDEAVKQVVEWQNAFEKSPFGKGEIVPVV